jgi:predicted MFS family arabinose efflux permease
MWRNLKQAESWIIVLAAAGILLITMGLRQSLGLFIKPITQTTALSVETLSLALAIGQFVWGAIQPFSGALADRYGASRVLSLGIVVMAGGLVVVPLWLSDIGLIISLGILIAMGSGASSFSVLMGATAQRLAPEARATASGVINAGSSFGQFIFAPITQTLINAFGWVNALFTMAVLTLSALPLVKSVTAQVNSVAHPHSADTGLWASVKTALRNPNYWLLNAGFFTCGFHVAFLVTHLPGEVNLCGLPASVASWSLGLIGLSNIFGSLFAGWCVSRYRSKYILAIMYASRAVLIVWYLMMPRMEWTYYTFAIGLGFTWLATVPPTAAIVGKLFGVRYMATLFGILVFSHQVGGFFGAYLGGKTLSAFGDFTWMWYADMGLALMAALVNLPIKEAPISKAA